MLPVMAVYTSVLSRKEQGEEKVKAYEAYTCVLFPTLILLSGPTGLNVSLEQAH